VLAPSALKSAGTAAAAVAAIAVAGVGAVPGKQRIQNASTACASTSCDSLMKMSAGVKMSALLILAESAAEAGEGDSKASMRSSSTKVCAGAPTPPPGEAVCVCV